jgi:hypothetical protein
MGWAPMVNEELEGIRLGRWGNRKRKNIERLEVSGSGPRGVKRFHETHAVRHVLAFE